MAINTHAKTTEHQFWCLLPLPYNLLLVHGLLTGLYDLVTLRMHVG